MKQILQSLKTGETKVSNVPIPTLSSGHLLIESISTLVSTGTERMLVEFGKAGWLEKARQQPDKVKLVLDKIKTDGLQPTLDAILNKLDQPLPLGYCNVGRIIQVGSGVVGFKYGDRVASNGKHAEVVSSPQNLCALVPDGVSDDEATFTVLAAIALQGIRLSNPTLGETFVVTGLGLLGLITVQLLRAHGCRVIGIDFDKTKLELAKKFGAEIVDLSAGQDPVELSVAYSRGRGVDAVIITATTKSSDPVHQAALMCRKRGRIILVGVTGLNLSRDDFYKKELTFQVSASYGPGRYDSNYEEKGHDYPFGFVRWTEQRNFEAVLDMMSDGRLDVKPLISHRFSIENAGNAYSLIGGSDPFLGILITYPGLTHAKDADTVILTPTHKSRNNMQITNPKLSFIGAGNYAGAILIPAFKKAGAELRYIVSNGGVSGLHVGQKFGFDATTTDSSKSITDIDTDAIVITTQHNSHAHYTLKALEAGKHIFCEKPLCLTLEELSKIENAYSDCSYDSRQPILMVGFNRRFAPQILKIKELLQGTSGPKSFVMTVNAGAIPMGHWTQDPDVGGGRLIGEICHFIDLLRCLADSPIVSWSRTTMDSVARDTVSILLKFSDGSVGSINYFANGPKSYPKERLEIFSQGRVLLLENFRKLSGYGWPNFKKLNLWRQDKGQYNCAYQYLEAIKNGAPSPIPIDEIFEVTRVSIELARS